MAIQLNTIKPNKTTAEVKQSFSDKLIKLLTTEINLGTKKFSDKKKEKLYAEMNILLSSGIDIRTTIELIQAEYENKEDQKMLQGINEDMTKGLSLSEAIHQTHKFTEYEYFSLKIGEESGMMEEVLLQLSKFYSDRLNQRRQITNALAYPSIVIVSSIGMIIFMLQYVVPMFEQLFKQFHGELPGITQFLLTLSGLLNHYGWVMVLIILIIVVAYRQVRKKTLFRKYASNIILKIPFFGKMVQKIYLAQFSQSMHLLLVSQTPINQSLGLIKKMIGFYPIESSIDPIIEDLTHGATLNQCMRKYSIYDRRMVSLIKVAEEVKQLDTMFSRLSKQYSEELDHQSKMLSNIIQPILLLFIGGVVGFIVLAMYLPLFQLSSIME